MKTSLIFKLVFVLPILLFLDYLVMVLFGCATCLFGFDGNFHCSNYCIIGKTILFLSIIAYGIILYPDIKQLINLKKNGSPS